MYFPTHKTAVVPVTHEKRSQFVAFNCDGIAKLLHKHQYAAKIIFFLHKQSTLRMGCLVFFCACVPFWGREPVRL